MTKFKIIDMYKVHYFWFEDGKRYEEWDSGIAEDEIETTTQYLIDHIPELTYVEFIPVKGVVL